MKKEKIINENIIASPLNDLISERYGEYAKYIIQERSIPDARDGLKPVQRRILYAMYKDGNTNDKPYRKSAKTVGLVIGNYHPHGDSSVYDAMVRLSQPWKINYPLIQMHGNNGSIDDDPAAAMRYTEARLAAISDELLKDIDKNTVSWTPNFDDTENEPTVLPAKFPNLLVNGCEGVATGYATNIPPHNLAEIIDGTIYRIENADCSLEELMQYIKGPDFPTKAIIQGIQGIKKAFTTGKGSIVIRSKTAIETEKNGIKHIIVTEIPYGVIKSSIVKKIDDIRFNKSIDGIMDVRDASDRNGLKIIIDINKDADANNILNYLLKKTELQITFNYNMVAIVNNRPVYLGLREALDAYIDYYKDFVLKRTKFEFEKKENRCHILEGLIKAVSVLDEVIKIIRNSTNKENAKKNLIERFAFTEQQAEAIVILRLYRLTNTDVLELRDEYRQLVEQLKELKQVMDDPATLNNLLINELKEVKQSYGVERQSVIEDEIEDIQIDKVRMIANERVVITLSRDGYIKRVSLRSFNSGEGTITGLKDGDNLVGYHQADTVDTLVAFTESGEYVCLPIYLIEENKWKDIGVHISKYVKVNNSEKFINAYIVKDFNTYCWFITLSRSGMIKKTTVKDWQLQRTSKSSVAMNIAKDDKIVSALLAYDNDEVMIVTKNGYNCRYSINEIPNVSTKAKGVKAVKLAADDEATSMAIIDQTKSEAIYITEKGNYKRIKINDIPVTTRATKGFAIAKKNKTNPFNVTLCLTANLNDDLQLIADNKLLNLKAKEINLLGVDARFSIATIGLNWYHYNELQEVKIIDIPEKREKDFEEMTLEV